MASLGIGAITYDHTQDQRSQNQTLKGGVTNGRSIAYDYQQTTVVDKDRNARPTEPPSGTGLANNGARINWVKDKVQEVINNAKTGNGSGESMIFGMKTKTLVIGAIAAFILWKVLK